jgi:hypothetical protein
MDATTHSLQFRFGGLRKSHRKYSIAAMLQFRAEENKRGGAPLQNVILVFAGASDPSFVTPRQDDQAFVKIRPRPTDHTKAPWSVPASQKVRLVPEWCTHPRK